MSSGQPSSSGGNSEIVENDNTSADPTSDSFRVELEDFKSGLTAKQQETFQNARADHVKCKILLIQRDQERLKALMDFSRLRFFVERLVEFDAVCQSAKIGGENSTELSGLIWGPSLQILQVSQEDSNALDVLLDAYQSFGKRIPSLQNYNALVTERPVVTKCLEFMYLDLLQFHGKVLGYLTGKSWKKTFQARWRDYEKTAFEIVLKSFDAHSKVLEKLLTTWRQRRSEDDIRRQNDHFIRNHEDSEGLRRHISQYQSDREFLINGTQAFQDTSRRLNDYVIQYQDDRQDIQQHVNQYSQDREPLLDGADFSRQTHVRLNDHVIQYQDDRQELQRHIADYAEDRKKMLEMFRKQELQRKEDQKLEVLKWLSTPGDLQSELHEKFKSVWTEFKDTGRWILSQNKVFNWMNEDIPTSSLVWINGKKGAGKTILASLIIEECKKNPDFKTSYFYCQEDEKGHNAGSLAVLKGLLRQMVAHNEELLPNCYERRSRGKEILDEEKVVKSLLELFCEYDMKQFLIIDGLDECMLADRKNIVQFWTSMVEKCDGYSPGKIRVLLVSQDLHDMQKAMQSADILDLDPESTTHDIRRYVSRQTEKLATKFDFLTENDILAIKELVCTRAQGMFLFACLTVENLLAQPNARWLKHELRETVFPKELKDAYEKIISRLKRDLNENMWEEVKRIFTWLAGAKRPLKWYEIQAALSLNLDDAGRAAWDYGDNYLVNDIREMCGSLVQVLPGNCIKFIHSTTRSYILQSQGLDEKEIECNLTVLCLNYLTLPCFSPMSEENRRELVMDGRYIFQDYAISEWKHHMKRFIEIASPLLEDHDKGPEFEAIITGTLSKFVHFYQDSLGADQDLDFRQGNLPLLAQVSVPLRSLSPFPSHQSLSPFSSRNSQSQSQSSIPSSPGDQSSQQHQSQQATDPAAFCQEFAGQRFHADLVRLWTHICKHEKLDFKERHEVSLKSLGLSLEANRKTIEGLADCSGPDTHDGQHLRRLYGTRLYKCQRVNCDYFHEGFETEASRRNHADRHDRPYHCPVEGCSLVPFGFSTNKDCEKHVRQYHPDESGGQLAAFVTLGTRKVAEAAYGCEICGRKFTRLRSKAAHVDSHYGIRRHKCRSCDKAFTRENDRRRHEKIHLRRRSEARL